MNPHLKYHKIQCSNQRWNTFSKNSRWNSGGAVHHSEIDQMPDPQMLQEQGGVN